MEDSLAFRLFGTIPNSDDLIVVAVRLLAAVLLGAIVGVQREVEGKPAGVRTHALVTLGATAFTIVPLQAGMELGDLSRVIQGVCTGIGFIGAGVILKLRKARDVVGLTTSATIWTATAVGIAIGLGYVIYAAITVLLTWIVLSGLTVIDRWIEDRDRRTET